MNVVTTAELLAAILGASLFAGIFLVLIALRRAGVSSVEMAIPASICAALAVGMPLMVRLRWSAVLGDTVESAALATTVALLLFDTLPSLAARLRQARRGGSPVVDC